MAYKYRYRGNRWYSKYLDSTPIRALLVIVVLALAVWAVYPMFSAAPPEQATTTTTLATTTTTTLQQLSSLALAVKDAPPKLAGGTTVHALYLTIGNITAHTSGGDGWVDVSSGMKEVQLLDYTDISAIIGQGVLEPGNYTQIRLYITGGNISITNDYLYIYSPKTYPLTVPSKELKTAHEFTIELGKTTVLTMDFDVENSVTRTADGYTLRPVFKITEEVVGYGEAPANSTVI